MIPSMVLEGAGEPEELAERSGLDAAGDAIDAVVAALAGTFTWAASRPDPPGLPTVRAFAAPPRARWPCGGCARGWATR